VGPFSAPIGGRGWVPFGRRLPEQILHLLAAHEGGLPRAALRDRLRVNNERLGRTLVELERQGRVRRTPAGWGRSPKSPGETEAGSAGVHPAEG
jgi:hypothetical protein